MRPIKFRQPLFDLKGNFTGFHYWGFMKDDFVGDSFIGPAGYLNAKQRSNRNRQQEYTGLKDRNGTDIYEGDVVRFALWWFDGTERESELTGVVKYNPELLSYELSGITNPDWIGHVGGKEGDTDNTPFAFFRFEGDDFEVIGNIHQTPELLKAETV